MIKLTTLDGAEVRVRPEAIDTIEEPIGPWKTKNAGCLIEIGGTFRAIKETQAEVLRLLSYR